MKVTIIGAGNMGKGLTYFGYGAGHGTGVAPACIGIA